MQPGRLLLRIPAALRRAGPQAAAAGLVLALLATGFAPGPVAGSARPGPQREAAEPAALPQPPGKTTLVSQQLGGGFAGGGSVAPSISSNGRYVAFVSGAADLVAGDTNRSVDVFVRDRSKGTTIRLPLPGGRPPPAGGQASDASISADGSVVAFAYQRMIDRSRWDLGPVSRTEVYAWSRKTGKTEPVSASPRPVVGTTVPPPQAVNSRDPSVSGDGRFIAYTTDVAVTEEDSNQQDDVYRYDRVRKSTVFVSVGFDGGSSFGASTEPSISDKGSLVAFTSQGGDSIVNEDTGSGRQVYLRDIGNKRTERISGGLGGGTGGAPANGESSGPSISADGRYVAFESAANNLVAGTLNAPPQVYRRDRRAGLTELVSVDDVGQPSGGGGYQAAISRDGRMTAFTSQDDLRAAPSATGFRVTEIYIRDMTVGETALVTVNLGGGPSRARSVGPVVAGNGRFVAFFSTAPTLVKGDDNKQVDVFIRDLPPVPQLNPAVVEFGARAVGTDPVPGAAVLVNAGWGPLTVAGASTDGPAKGDFKVQVDGCARRVLHRSEACTVTILFTAQKPGTRAATLKVADDFTGSPRTARLLARASQATLKVSPEVGRPGLVVIATGSGFPEGAQVRLRWSRGITPVMPAVTADGSGGFRVQVLIFHHDQLGKRDLIAEGLDGSRFPPVSAGILVTEPPQAPPDFLLQRLLDLPFVLMFR